MQFGMYDWPATYQHGGECPIRILVSGIAIDVWKAACKNSRRDGHTTTFHCIKEASGGAAALEKCRNMYKDSNPHHLQGRTSSCSSSWERLGDTWGR